MEVCAAWHLGQQHLDVFTGLAGLELKRAFCVLKVDPYMSNGTNGLQVQEAYTLSVVTSRLGFESDAHTSCRDSRQRQHGKHRLQCACTTHIHKWFLQSVISSASAL